MEQELVLFKFNKPDEKIGDGASTNTINILLTKSLPECAQDIPTDFSRVTSYIQNNSEL